MSNFIHGNPRLPSGNDAWRPSSHQYRYFSTYSEINTNDPDNMILTADYSFSVVGDPAIRQGVQFQFSTNASGDLDESASVYFIGPCIHPGTGKIKINGFSNNADTPAEAWYWVRKLGEEGSSGDYDGDLTTGTQYINNIGTAIAPMRIGVFIRTGYTQQGVSSEILFQQLWPDEF